METKHDLSYGIVPISDGTQGVRVLLVEQVGQRGDVFWTLPKGHPEAGEAPTAAALRELYEETGVRDCAIVPGHEYEMNYRFVHEGVTVEKRVVFFLGRCAKTEVAIASSEEIRAAAWLPFEAAFAQVTHDTVREVLKNAARDLTQLSSHGSETGVH